MNQSIAQQYDSVTPLGGGKRRYDASAEEEQTVDDESDYQQPLVGNRDLAEQHVTPTVGRNQARQKYQTVKNDNLAPRMVV